MCFLRVQCGGAEMSKRREVTFTNHDKDSRWWGHSELALTITRKGIEVTGFYDSFVGLQGIYLTWEQVEETRRRVGTKADVEVLR